jgi:hypothetical protein
MYMTSVGWDIRSREITHKYRIHMYMYMHISIYRDEKRRDKYLYTYISITLSLYPPLLERHNITSHSFRIDRR